MPQPRQISGTLKNLSGEPYANQNVIIELVAGFYTPQAQYVKSLLEDRTNAAGDLSVLLVPNVGDTSSSYRLSVGGETWLFTVPEGTTELSWSEVRVLGVTTADPQHPTLSAFVTEQIAAAGGVGGGTGGTGINILGSAAAAADLPGSGAPGDAYLITPDLWVWSPNTNEYLNAGPVQGPPGADGLPGIAGVAGVAGPAGVPGVDGPAGATGLQGITGATGPAGADGVAGPTGATGPAGVAGATGPAGPQGTGLTILGSFATTADLPPSGSAGDAYLVQGDLYVWSATSNAYENVGRIQGPTGATGPAGVQGAQGIQGITGADGTTGAVGPAGPAGAQGLQGIQGDTGLAGPSGAAGATGSQGLKGDVGATGPAGAAGPQGTTGATGTTGAAGPQGLQGIKGDTGTTGAVGAAGPAGTTGAAGATGATGPGVPVGGTIGQIVTKTGTEDYATGWAAAPTGGTSNARQVLLWTGSAYPAKTATYALYIGPTDPATLGITVVNGDAWEQTL